jgi:pimeloyl-ACP methyl ester carboxylesterase
MSRAHLGRGGRPGLDAVAVLAGAASLWSLRHRRSQAVRVWEPSGLTGQHYGRLYARRGGEGEHATVLLHGLVSTGDVFGAAFDALATQGPLVVPDLLGFGRSLDESGSKFPIDAHLDALDDMAARVGLFDCRWRIGAHSMGSTLALRWASRHAERVDRVVCWGPPIYRTPEVARSEVSGSTMAKLFAIDTRWAARACALSCRNRVAAGWLAAALQPSIPVPVARTVPSHTWPAYRDAMRDLVLEVPWRDLLTELDHHHIDVRLVWGDNDDVGDVRYAREVAQELPQTTVARVAGADHYLPMSQPATCISQLVD